MFAVEEDAIGVEADRAASDLDNSALGPLAEDGEGDDPAGLAGHPLGAQRIVDARSVGNSQVNAPGAEVEPVSHAVELNPHVAKGWGDRREQVTHVGALRERVEVVPDLVGEQHRGAGDLGVPIDRLRAHLLLGVAPEPLSHLGDRRRGDLHAFIVECHLDAEVGVVPLGPLVPRVALVQIPEGERPAPVDQRPVIEPAHADTLRLQSP
jgi:hypothetical protein